MALVEVESPKAEARVAVTGAATEQALECVAEKLRSIEHGSGWARTTAIGAIMISAFFCGSIENWRNRAKGSSLSIRRLAARDDCPLRKSALLEALGVYAFVQENPRVRALARIAPGHVAAVLGCEPSESLRLLEQAQRDNWGVRALTLHARQARNPNRSGAVSSATRLHSSLKRIERSLERTLAEIDERRAWRHVVMDTESRQLLQSVSRLLSRALVAAAAHAVRIAQAPQALGTVSVR
jgi:hypothetical protein